MTSEVIRIDTAQIVEIGDSMGKTEADQGIHKIIGGEILELTQGQIKILKDKTIEESIEIITEMRVMDEVEIGTGLEKKSFSRDFSSNIKQLGYSVI